MLKKQSRSFIARFVISAVLLVTFVNPYIESSEYRNALVFMFSHYALFIAGFVITYGIVKTPRLAMLPVSIVSVYWHLPIPFALSGALPFFRLIEELSLFTAGLVAGSAVNSLSSKAKSALLGLWVLADTGLSVMFLVLPRIYSHAAIPLSPYPPFQFVMLGIAMVFFMNVVVAFVVYSHVRHIGAILREPT